MPGDSHPGGRWDGHVLRRKVPSPRPASLSPPPSPTGTGLPQPHLQLGPEGDGWEPGIGDVNEFTHCAWLKKLVHKDKNKDPKLLGKARTCLELLPIPEDRQEKALQGTECQEHFQTHTASVPPKYR